MKTLMLDISAYAAFMRGHLEAISAIRKAQSVIIPVVAMGELLAGFEVGSHRQKNRAELQEFLSSPRVRVVETNQETSERYALIYAYLRGVGRPVPTNDLWIAASAMEHSATLLTADAHFLHIPQIIVTQI